ncbi:MAG: hypothetical protein OEY56_08130 [Cyclobacteriaceae bacterium]|nr:hypothetical protein [Cyclobacteriaceae bacterium]
MNTIVIENELVVCELDSTHQILKHRWKKNPTSEEFRNQLMGLQQEYVRLKPAHPQLKWLADTKLLGEITYEDEKWLENIWEHLLFEEAGVRVHAVILSDDIFPDYSMEKFKIQSDKKYAKKGASIGVFLDEESAYEWLIKNGQ